jgi:bifunctional non-homologous end joining protein LigD
MAASGKKLLHYIKPMLATPVDQPFNNTDWLFELKLDGYRAVAEINGGKIWLYSRNGLLLGERYPLIVAELKKIKTLVILDGEIVLLNDKGKADFQKLQSYSENEQYPLVYYVFDILSMGKNDLKEIPLLERKKLLKKLLKRSGTIRYCDHVEDNGIGLFKKIKAANLEGIIAKKKDSRYIPGIRTREWLKIKHQQSQEVIIVGFTEPKGSRKYFGSLLLAQYQKGKLQYIGHAGTGFTDQSLKELMQKMKPLITGKSPFDRKIKANGPVTWLKPVLVGEAAYSELTKDGIMRHPVYKGLRPDKKSKMIQSALEKPLPVKKRIHSLK